MKSKQITLLIVIFLFGLVLGYFLFKTPKNISENADQNSSLERQGGFQFINPLLTCDISDSDYPLFDSLKNDLTKLSDSLKFQGKARKISIYFRDLNPGHFTGVNEDDLFIPASLMKVPTLIAYLEDSRKNPGVLNQKIQYALVSNEEQYFQPKETLTPGDYYTVNDLLSAMIKYSDNNAATLLLQTASSSALQDVYSYSGIFPSSDENADIISPKQYSNIFRLLYNAGFLGDTRSQAALTLLSETDFGSGIAAGVEGHTVAHKFGERTIRDQNQNVIKRELHDCGIVYYPGTPYILCVMTEGSDFNDLESVIAEISKNVYQDVKRGLLSP